MEETTLREDNGDALRLNNEPLEWKKRAGGSTKSEQGVRRGLSFARHFTSPEIPAMEMLRFVKRRSEIREPDGTVVFEMDAVEVPESWSQLATDIVVSKYFRKADVPHIGRETSVKEVVYRIAHTIRAQGEQTGYFCSKEDAHVFEEELTYLLLSQKGAFNSPVWFNCGLHHVYKITGSGGNWCYDSELAEPVEIENTHAHPQCSACFIQQVDDNLMSIFDLLKKEARVFKYGSGTGTNFSHLRSCHEPLSGGGTSSGLMSFLEVFDKSAGATKSGGTTRRAAKMVCLDMDHPEILEFVRWKANEENKAKTLISGGYDADFNGEAYHTVSGQNSNNSVRITDAFMEAYANDGDWETTYRTSGETHKVHKARELMREIAQAAWSCADPGVQFDTTINRWHTCSETDRIYASNPCSEFMFLNDTACNLASLNLMQFRRPNGDFDLESYRSAIRVFATAMEILVHFGSYPNKDITQNSHDYRPLGLGYANLGTLLMVDGLPYDSEEGRAKAAALTAILCGEAYAASAELAAQKGPFPGYEANRSPMLKVIASHREQARKINTAHCSEVLWQAAQEAWDKAENLGRQHGYRNAQMTVLAPTGTIGLVMDCDTTGVEPDFSLIKWKKLAGGGYMKIVNQSLSASLENLGYDKNQIDAISDHILGTRTLNGKGVLNDVRLKELGFDEEQIVEAAQAIKQSGNLHDYTPHINPTTLKAKGLSAEEVFQAQREIGGMETIEGAPYLKVEHLPVFDCANRCGATGKRFIKPIAHVRMMAAVQPFISGAISKTINVPEETTSAEIEELYVESWRQGLKAVSLYRDNSKGSQPLSSRLGENEKTTVAATPESEDLPELRWGERRVLPRERQGTTLAATVGGHKLFLRAGEYENGDLGEIFIDMYKEGAAYRSMMNSFARAVSVGLSYGVPLEKYVNMYTFTRFEPYGVTDHPNVRTSTSILDFIFRILGMKYLGRWDFVHVPPEEFLAKQLDTDSDGIPANQAAPIETKPDPVSSASPGRAPAAKTQQHNHGALDGQLAEMMGDAPVCDGCGHLTVRNGSCYRCLNCGNSMGCS